MPLDVDDRYAFWNGQLEKLGADDPIEVLATTPARLGALAASRDDAAWRRVPAPGKWSALAIASHLLDIEWVFGFRVRTVLWDDRPRLIGMDHDAWVEGQRDHDATPAERAATFAATFAAVRDANVRLWRRLGPGDLARVGIHDDADVELTVDLLLRIQAGHDRWHLERIEALLGP